jgi:hypothetical protein
MPKTKLDAETVIADFLGDIADGHARVGGSSLRRSIPELRKLGRVLIADLKENGFEITGATAPSMKYVSYDYEVPGEPNNYWHIYTLDNEPPGMFDNSTVFTMVAPGEGQVGSAVAKICEAIDAAIHAYPVFTHRPNR